MLPLFIDLTVLPRLAKPHKKFSLHIRSLTGKTQKSAFPDLTDPEIQQTLHLSQHKAHLINSFFAQQTKLEVPDSVSPDDLHLPVNSEKFSYLETTPSEVFDVLSASMSGNQLG